MDELLAKSTGETLIEHSRKVAEVAEYIADSVIVTSDTEKKHFISVIRKAALLHDIGKAETEFQTLLRNSLNGKSTKTKKKDIIFSHNEVGWAFVRMYISFDSEELRQVAEAVYWHHGIHNVMGKHTDASILEWVRKKKDNSIDRMIEFVEELFPGQVLDRPRIAETSSPHYYIRDFNETSDLNVDNTIIRMCVVRADHLVSELGDFTVDEIKKTINERLIQQHRYAFTKCPYPGHEKRWTQQVALASRTTSFKTVQINAPAGYGKTLLGLLWSTVNNKRLIWVCPRNAVAQSVYHNILRELKNAGIETSVELYYAGKQQASNSDLGIKFSSDIIVTNVDNFLRPTKEHCNDIDLLMVSDADVVFDEYHELVSDGALLAGFINLMKVRHQMTNGRSLLLSATPLDLSVYWDSFDNSTAHLPGKFEHAPAVHNKSYKLTTKEGRSRISESKKSPVLFISNSIVECQRNKHKHNEDTILFHGKFEDDDNQARLSVILQNYGKQSDRNIEKEHVIASPIAQASLDVSFRHLIESCLSPEATLQRVGRVDRWGDYDDQSEILTYRIPSDNSGRSENRARETMYSRELSDLWFNFLTQSQGETTLDNLYSLYNKHCKENEALRRIWLNTKYRQSRMDLHEKIYPNRLTIKSENSEVHKIQETSYRSKGNEIFFTAKKWAKKEWTQPKSTPIYDSIPEDFHEDSNALAKVFKIIKHLNDEPDCAFDYTRFLKVPKHSTNLELLRIMAKYKSMPYPRMDMEYHDIYGYIKKTLLEEFDQPIYE